MYLPKSKERESIKNQLKNIVDNKSSMSSRVDTINSYVLALMYNVDGDEKNYIKYLI